MNSSGNQPIISVIVPCRGHASELPYCLRALQLQNVRCTYEIILVDSASDEAVARVAAEFPCVNLVRSDAGLLAGSARNLGVKHAATDYLVFTDSDCIPETTFLEAALSALQSGVLIVGGPVLDARPYHPIAVADNLLQFADFPATRPTGRASYFPACNLAVCREVFLQLGGFRTDLPCCEDTLFCQAAMDQTDRMARLHRADANQVRSSAVDVWVDSIWFDSAMCVRHSGRASFGAMWVHQESFGYQRALLGIKLRPLFQRLGRLRSMIVVVMMKRLIYIFWKTARWHPLGLPRMLFLLPLLAVGLLAWARGFRRGCIESARAPS